MKNNPFKANKFTRRALLGRAAALIGTVAIASIQTGCGSGGGDNNDPGNVHVGKILNVNNGLVAFHVDPPGNASSRVRIYACDGLPTSAGGFALWFTGTVADGTAGLTAVGSTARIVFAIAGNTAAGTITLADGRVRTFTADVKTDGSGIYDVVIGADRSYKGNSTRGDSIDAVQAAGTGGTTTVTGTITSLNGAKVTVNLVRPSGGLFAVDSFTAVVLIGAGVSGRSGDVRRGLPGLNIIEIPWD